MLLITTPNGANERKETHHLNNAAYTYLSYVALVGCRVKYKVLLVAAEETQATFSRKPDDRDRRP